MVFSILSVFVAFGAVVGTSEGIQASMRRSRKEEHRTRKNNLIVNCPKSSAYSSQLEGRQVVLSGGRLFVDTNPSTDPEAPFGHPFAGYFLPYPEAKYPGLVSTITDEAPIMNWVFAERETYAIGYGARAAAEGNFTGPWDVTRQDRRLTFGGWEGFMAVRIPPAEDGTGGGFWALYFDRDGDRMKSKLADWPKGTVAVEVTLTRHEMRTPKPEYTPEQLEELKKKMAEAEAEKAKLEAEKGEEKAGESQSQDASERENTDRAATEKAEQSQGTSMPMKAQEDDQYRQKPTQEKKAEEVAASEIDKNTSTAEQERAEWEVSERQISEQKRTEQEGAKTQSRTSSRSRKSRRRRRRSPMAPEQLAPQHDRTNDGTSDRAVSEVRSSSGADDDGDDEYSSSVYSFFSDSRRASSSGMSLPDSDTQDGSHKDGKSDAE